jgi:hypothetical protein
MSNSGISDIYPVLVAASVDMVDEGAYALPLMVNRDVESQIASFGKSIVVPIAPSFNAQTYTPGSTITPSGVIQESVTLELNKSKSVVISLSDSELSLPAIKLQESYFAPMIEGLLKQVNEDIASELATATTKDTITISGEIDYSDLISAKEALDGQRAAGRDRYVVLPSDWYNGLLEDSSFKSQTMAADQGVITNGVLGTRLGFGIAMNHALSTSGFAFQKGAVAFAARVYAQSVPGVMYSVFNYKGIPIRCAMWGSSLSLNIQVDILYGVELVKGGRTVKFSK